MIGKLDMVVLDAADELGLARFYAQLGDWEYAQKEPEWVAVTTADGWRIGIQRSHDHRPPQWPGQEYPQQAHLDLRVPDLEAALRRATSLGATLLRRNESWYTVADPAGHPFDLCLSPDNPAVTIMGVMLDCPDAGALAAFYSALLSKPVTYEAEGVAMIGDDGAQPVMFQQVEAYTPPRWPDPSHPQQFHLDVLVPDLDEAESATLALGARRLPNGAETFRVFLDPADKPFCLCLEPG